MARVRRYKRRRSRGEVVGIPPKGDIPPPERPGAFRTVDALLEAARQMLHARGLAAAAAGPQAPPGDRDRDRDDERLLRRYRRQARAWTTHFHRSFDLSGEIPLCRRCRRARLNRLEREILLVAVMLELALVESDGPVDCGDVPRLLCLSTARTVQAMRLLSHQGRLYRSGLIGYDDEDCELSQRSIVPDPILIEEILGRSPRRGRRRPRVSSEEELFKRLAAYTIILSKKASAYDHARFGGDKTIYQERRRAHRAYREIMSVLRDQPRWALSRLLAGKEHAWSVGQRIIFLALLGKEMGHLDADDDLFRGIGLARAAADRLDEVAGMLKQLQPGSPLIKGELVQPAGGEDLLASASAASVARTEFELADRSIELLGLSRRLGTRRDGSALVRDPLLRLNQLVLDRRVRRALDLALAQARHGRVLVKQWGLGEVLPYGRAVTLLFSGPPGVGKTACAEALASELGQPILVADYARIQNCFVGMTEKNIVATFRAARRAGAVLFWDEADAMFYDRDMSRRSWEVRDVNVLLQQLERFEGVCILASNRRISLDPALERRITLKVEFTRPDAAARLKLWRKLLPRKLPLAKDVDLARLARADLSGGEIKNAVLNAARLALVRDPRGGVNMGDLEEAVEMELRARRGSGRAGDTIGFAAG